MKMGLCRNPKDECNREMARIVAHSLRTIFMEDQGTTGHDIMHQLPANDGRLVPFMSIINRAVVRLLMTSEQGLIVVVEFDTDGPSVVSMMNRSM